MEEYVYAAEQFALLCATRINYIAPVSVEANRLLKAVLSSHFFKGLGVRCVVDASILCGWVNGPNVGEGEAKRLK